MIDYRPFLFSAIALALSTSPSEAQSSSCSAEVVFILDTSGSMSEEVGALCAVIDSVEQALLDQNIIPITHEYRIVPSTSVTPPPGCVQNVVTTDFGTTVPGPNPGGCANPFPNTEPGRESWGPATAVIAANFPWTPGYARIVVPISDEFSCLGGTGTPDAADVASVDNAVSVCLVNNCYAFPIRANGPSNAALEVLMSTLATGTGGTLLFSNDPPMDMAAAIESAVFTTCVEQVPDIESPDGVDLAASVGAPLSFPIVASDPNGDMITLSASQLPAGATTTPALPLTGPGFVSTLCEWTPASEGTFVFGFEVVDSAFQLSTLDVVITVAPATGPTFIRGDFDGGGVVNVADAIQIVTWLFVSGARSPTCVDAADANDDGQINASDVIHTLAWLFSVGSPTIPAPYPNCGPDPTGDSVGCLQGPIACP